MDGHSPVTGFEQYDDATLTRTHANLLKGLDVVAAASVDGTIDVQGPKGEAEPRQAGHLTLAFLALVSLELAKRGLPSVAVSLDREIRKVNSGN